VTGIEFADYLAEGVLEPLGMGGTELQGSAAFAGSGSVRDLTSFAAELLAATLIPRVSFDNAVEVQFPLLAGILPGLGRFDPLDWGLGFERNFGRPGHWAGTKISPSAFGHFGASGTFLWVDPSAGVAAVCLSDKDFGPWSKQAWPHLSDAILASYAGFDRPV
jgi:CubicO group peptidase (beta-lactamase class C family)